MQALNESCLVVKDLVIKKIHIYLLKQQEHTNSIFKKISATLTADKQISAHMLLHI